MKKKWIKLIWCFALCCWATNNFRFRFSASFLLFLPWSAHFSRALRQLIYEHFSSHTIEPLSAATIYKVYKTPKSVEIVPKSSIVGQAVHRVHEGSAGLSLAKAASDESSKAACRINHETIE